MDETTQALERAYARNMGTRAVAVPFTLWAQTIKIMVAELRYLFHGYKWVQAYGVMDGATSHHLERAKKMADILIELDWPRAYLGSQEELSQTTDLIEWAIAL